MKQSSGSIPEGPAVILVHLASVWVPYTSEGKEAIASYPEILKEIKLALQEVARKLGVYLSKKRRKRFQEERREMFKRYAVELADSLNKLTGVSKEDIHKKLLKSLEQKIKDIELGTEEGVELLAEGSTDEKKERKPQEEEVEAEYED